MIEVLLIWDGHTAPGCLDDPILTRTIGLAGVEGARIVIIAIRRALAAGVLKCALPVIAAANKTAVFTDTIGVLLAAQLVIGAARTGPCADILSARITVITVRALQTTVDHFGVRARPTKVTAAVRGAHITIVTVGIG